jgi:hypothetical protein
MTYDDFSVEDPVSVDLWVAEDGPGQIVAVAVKAEDVTCDIGPVWVTWKTDCTGWSRISFFIV